jgi:hypothetical protein
MKYLKTYKLLETERFSKEYYNKHRITSERLEILLDTLDDMFLDAKDDGFRLNYSGTLLNINITKSIEYHNDWSGPYSRPTLFRINEVSDTIYMIMSYLDTFSDVLELEIIEVDLSSESKPKFKKEMKRGEIDSIKENIWGIRIRYKEKFIP